MFGEVHLAVRKKAVDLAMEQHHLPRREARRIIQKVTEDQVNQCCTQHGLIIPSSGFDFTSMVQWIKDHWKEILKVALSVLGIAMMFASKAILKSIAVFKEANPDHEFPILADEDDPDS